MRKDDCIYLSVCDKECPQTCLRYDEMQYLLKSSNIPKIKQTFNVLIPDNCDIKAFEQLADIRDNIAQFVLDGKNLYLYSTTCGNGKTTWAIKLMLQYFNEIWPANCYKSRGIFINTNTFLFELKDSFDKYNETVENLKRQVADVDLVIWDDIASNRMSVYDTDLILSLVDKRVVNGKANIFTSNITPSNLSSCIGNRLASRVCGQSVIKIELKGKDNR